MSGLIVGSRCEGNYQATGVWYVGRITAIHNTIFDLQYQTFFPRVQCGFVAVRGARSSALEPGPRELSTSRQHERRPLRAPRLRANSFQTTMDDYKIRLDLNKTNSDDYRKVTNN